LSTAECNHTQVKRITDKVGAVLELENAIPPVVQEYAAPAAELIVQVDGGHIPIQAPENAVLKHCHIVSA